MSTATLHEIATHDTAGLDNGTDNGAANSNETPAVVSSPAWSGERPKTKTGACRQLLKEGFTETEEICRLAKERWGHDAKGADVSNAKKAEQEERQKKKEERQRKRQDAVANVANVANVGMAAASGDLLTAQNVIDGLCLTYGLATVRDLLAATENRAGLLLKPGA